MSKKENKQNIEKLKDKKSSKEFKKEDNSSKLAIPIEIFKDRNVAVLESLVEYLKDKKGLSYHEIAVLLNRDDRTIWTVYNRVSKKRKK